MFDSNEMSLAECQKIFKCEEDANGIRLIGFKKKNYTPSEIVFPGYVDGNKVIIAGDGFANNVNLESVILPEGVVCVTEEGFWNCSNLKNVYISSTVVELSGTVFKDCSSLSDINIPETVKNISRDVFMNTPFEKHFGDWLVINGMLLKYMGDSASDVYIPENIHTLGSNAFDGKYSIKRIMVPGSVKKIRRAAFKGINGIEEIILEDGIERIESEAFYFAGNPFGRPGLQLIRIPGSVKYIGENALHGPNMFLRGKVDISPNNSNFKIEEGILYSTDGKIGYDIIVDAEEVIFQDGTETIESGVFRGSRTKKVTYPDTVKKIKEYALPVGPGENYSETVITILSKDVDIERKQGLVYGDGKYPLIKAYNDSMAKKFADEKDFGFENI